MRIACGTRSAPKLEAVRNLVERLSSKISPAEPIEVTGYAAVSGISDMPASLEETSMGAENRARHALVLDPEATYGIGIEGGMADFGGKTYLFGVVAVERRDGESHIGISPWVEIPEWAARETKETGRELSQVIDAVTGAHGSKHRDGTFGLLMGGAMSRANMFEVAGIAAFGPFLEDIYRMAPGARA